MTAQELKKSILQLAVQGKLVPQNPNDEPASELFKRICIEKAKLIEEGKIKKEKPLSPITNEELPFDIPNTWKWARISEVTYFQEGPGILGKDFRQAGIPLIRISGMQGTTVSLDGCNYLDPQMVTERWSHFKLDKGDIVISTSASLDKIATVTEEAEGTIPYTGLIRFKMFEGILSEYFIWFIKSPLYMMQIDMYKKGDAIKHYGPTHLKKMLIPLPPLSEQKRIVAKIEELLPFVEEYNKTEKRLAKLNVKIPDKLRKSILQQAVQGKLTERHPNDEPASELLKRIREERVILQKNKMAKKSQASQSIDENEIPFDIPDTWAWVNLGWLCQKVGAGSTPKGGSAVYVPQGIKFLREQNVHDDGLHLDSVAYITEETHMTKVGSHVEAKDILMNITGGSIGRNALVPNDFDTANVNQHVLIIRLVNKELRHYLHYCFSAPVILNQMFKKQAGDKPGLSATKVENFLVPLPPLEEQKRIVARVEELLAVCDKLK